MNSYSELYERNNTERQEYIRNGDNKEPNEWTVVDLPMDWLVACSWLYKTPFTVIVDGNQTWKERIQGIFASSDE